MSSTLVRRAARWRALPVALLFVACAAPPSAPPPDEAPVAGTPSNDAEASEPAPPAPPGVSVRSNAGSFFARILPAPEEMPLNEEFDLSLWLFRDEACREPLGRDLELAVDARMPAHGHGMTREVVPVPQPDGSWRVDGMLLHMIGHWELYLDVTRGARTERAQFDVELSR
jgi:hypothetical protein